MTLYDFINDFNQSDYRCIVYLLDDELTVLADDIYDASDLDSDIADYIVNDVYPIHKGVLEIYVNTD